MLKNKVAIITGANSGVGAACAKLFAQNGAKVIMGARRLEALEAVAQEIKEQGGEAVVVRADISKDEDCKALVQAAMDNFGQLDILVNNAGVLDSFLKGIAQFDDEEIQKVIGVNEIGTMQCMRAALPVMKYGSSIVNVASVAGFNGGGGAAYVASKAAIIGITKHTAMSYAKEGIRCNAVCPGTIATPMVAGMDPAQLDARVMGGMALHSDLQLPICQPIDVANIVAFLASDLSKALTGQIIVSDFGVNL